ncbi:anti-apoptotic protein NR13-like [Mobula hypostoma]|uniref:anti-apoptotic protein NR13-like n=1 Tax=Mobula hypostoma TaxID=723540 RepID=UPI002FC28BB6
MPDSDMAERIHGCLREETLVLVQDYLQHCLSLSWEQRPPNKMAFTLRKVAYQMVEQHQAAFSNMKNGLENGLQVYAMSWSGAAGPVGESVVVAEDIAVVAANFLRRVVEEMLADEKINWGWVVCIFTSTLCHHFRDSGLVMCPEAGPGPLNMLAKSVANCLGKERREWIQKNGGWDGFLRFFSRDEHWQESTVRNMLIKVAGFGIAGLACLLADRYLPMLSLFSVHKLLN